MKSHTVYRTFNTERRREFVRITEDVQSAVDQSGIAEGMVLVSAMHITAGVWVNDDEPGIQADALEWLDKLAPATSDARSEQRKTMTAAISSSVPNRPRGIFARACSSAPSRSARFRSACWSARPPGAVQSGDSTGPGATALTSTPRSA